MPFALIAAAMLSTSHAPPTVPSSPCADLVRDVPARARTAPGASELIRSLQGMTGADREEAFDAELQAGNIPAFLRRLVPVTLSGVTRTGHTARVTICVAPDYLAIGSDADFMLVPLRLRTALDVARRFGFTLPTRRIVDAIYRHAVVRLRPQPLPAGEQMRSTRYYALHDALVREQRQRLHARLGALTAGDKKDLVLTDRLFPALDRVAIYGWHRRDGAPIQPLSTVHGVRYADYSHGVRLVSTTAFVDGRRRSLFDLLRDPELSPVLSDEGPVVHAADIVDSPHLAVSAGEAIGSSGSRGGNSSGYAHP